ncbi:MAG TPA: glycosyltransferase family 2 protein [Gemmatimonadales bacterium]|jgi:glycosyltransferase involved in cell wall biosynthesis|nr:glycosyltransferase family 2 protein [Gemmatimonadales bacterium]
MTDAPAVTIVVPVLNEEPNVAPLVEGVREALREGPTWELLFVDDGSSDGTAAAVLAFAGADDRIRLIALARNYGQTAALQAGFDHARGHTVISMDGDLQNDPADIPALVAKLEEGYDLVAGYRRGRQDAWLSRKLPSWVANRVLRWITGVPIRDTGCSLKAYRRELIDRLALYSDLHRFIPTVAAATAGARIVELEVRHHPRQHGRSKYGLSRVGKVLADLLTLRMIHSFRERPLLLFASGALVAAVLGLLFAGAAAVSMAGFQPAKANALVLPATACVWFALSWYLLMLGLIAETALWEARAEHPEPGPLAHRA